MWGALIGAGVGLLGSKMESKAAEKAAANAGAPWAGAKPYVTQGYADAQGALNDAMDMGAYSGPRTAEFNPWQTAGLNTMGNFGLNQGITGAETVFGAGMNNIGNASQFGSNAASMFAQSGQDPTQRIIQNAQNYASNPFLDGQIDAASRDVVRNLNENQLTGLDLAASGSGNMNSSRTGVAAGIMQRGAADRIADISAQMRGDAYNNGLGMAQQQYNTGINQGLNANGQLLQAGQFGADQIGNGIGLGYNAGNAMTQAGTGFQNQAQNVINGQMAAHTDQQNNSLDLLGKYMGIINGNFQTGGTVQPTNTFGNVLSGALGGLSLASQWNKSTTPAATYGSSVDSRGTTGYASPDLMARAGSFA